MEETALKRAIHFKNIRLLVENFRVLSISSPDLLFLIEMKLKLLNFRDLTLAKKILYCLQNVIAEMNSWSQKIFGTSSLNYRIINNLFNSVDYIITFKQKSI